MRVGNPFSPRPPAPTPIFRDSLRSQSLPQACVPRVGHGETGYEVGSAHPKSGGAAHADRKLLGVTPFEPPEIASNSRAPSRGCRMQRGSWVKP